MKITSAHRRRPFTHSWILVLGLITTIHSAGSEGSDLLDVHGLVLDADTRQPLEGANVSAAFREKLSWWQKLMLTPEGLRRPRIRDTPTKRTDAAGGFSIEAVSSIAAMRRQGEETWPAEIILLTYWLCGYDIAYQRLEGDYPLKENEVPLYPGKTQRVEMRRARPGSSYYSDKC